MYQFTDQFTEHKKRGDKYIKKFIKWNNNIGMAQKRSRQDWDGLYT